MMKGLLSLAAGALPASVFAAAVVGQPAPAFSARDLAGNPVSLAELKASTDTFGPLVRRVEWAPDRHRVKLDGAGFRVEMWVDAQDVHATGDIPILAGLLGSQLGSGLKQIVQQTFQNKLP